MQSLPKEITYEMVRPRGFMSEFKEWPIDPMSSNAYWQPNQIVRFLLMLDQGWMDPFRSYLQIQVQVDPALNIGGVQLDSSAQSFISQLVIFSNSVEVQRISQYDTLAAILTDFGYSQQVSQGRDLQGLGCSQWVPSQSNKFPSSSNGTSYVVQGSSMPTPYYQLSASNGINPTKSFMIPPLSQTSLSGAPALGIDNWFQFGGYNSSQFSMVQSWSNNYSNSPLPQYLGHYNNVRAQYASCIADDKYPQVPQSINLNGYVQQNTQLGYDKTSKLGIVFPAQTYIRTRGFHLTNLCGLQGYNKAYSQYTSRGTYQPLISNVIPQCSMRNGNILPVPRPVRRRTFLVPILSSTVGVLIPPDQYKLLPLKALSNLLLQITLNPYAMFSTGLMDRNQFDLEGSGTAIPRAFRIARMQWILNIYNFPSQAIRSYMQGSLTKGIAITGMSWMLGSQYQIPNGQVIRNSWQINSTAQSLAQVVIAFLPNDYQKWPYCRKQFRLSNNITSFQLKFNTNYYPPQPIIGNAGNPEPLQGQPDNMNYYLLLLKSGNWLFNTNMPLPRINRVNFAINQRCYDPSKRGSLAPVSLKSSLLQQPGTNPALWNTHTAMGLPFFHENRFVGKAIYTYSFQPFAHSKQYTMGVDSRQARPFQVMFQTANDNWFPRDQTMYVFLKHNVLTLYSDKGVQVIGR